MLGCAFYKFCRAIVKDIHCHHKWLNTTLSRSLNTDPSCWTLQDIVNQIENGRVNKIVVMAGAGISTPSGIPDFRTPGSGLYDNVKKYNLPYPEAMFDIDYFSIRPEPFFALSKELYPSGYYRPNVAHYMIRLLQEKDLLLRMYTQNIDGLERRISPDKLVEAHGTYATATCQGCLQSYNGEDIKVDILEGKVPMCGKKTCKAVVKPDIVFFGEQLPKRFYKHIIDMPLAHLLIIMGTSLEVYPFAGIADMVCKGTPRVMFNMDAAGPFAENPRKNDVLVTGDVVSSVNKFCDILGWKEDLDKLISKCENTSES